jgi:hypothetical protein
LPVIRVQKTISVVDICHVLVGTNHNSDSDVRMTRLMTLILLERLDPTTKDPDFLGAWALQNTGEQNIRRAKYKAKRANETAEERRIRVVVVSERTKRRPAKETSEARRIQLVANNTMQKVRETPEVRRIRHAAISENMRKKIEKETPEE